MGGLENYPVEENTENKQKKIDPEQKQGIKTVEEQEQGTKTVEKQEQGADVVEGAEEQRNQKMKNLTIEFTEPLKIYPVLSRKISEIMNKHGELINKGEENPIVCLAEIINNTRNYLKQFDGDIYRQMENTEFFKRYNECITEVVNNLDITKYGEFFFNLRDTIKKEVEESSGNIDENNENKRNGEFRFVPRVVDSGDSGEYPMLKFEGLFKQPS